jgi:hypothetical protein
MASIEERRRWRDLMLMELYRETDGQPLRSSFPKKLAEAVGIPPEEVQQTSEALRGDGLVDNVSLAGDIELTNEGRRRAEDLLAQESPLPLTVVLTIAERRELEPVLRELRLLLDGGETVDLPTEDLADATAQLATAEAQMLSPRPRRAIVGEALKSLRLIAENAAGTMAAAGIIEIVGRVSGLRA